MLTYAERAFKSKPALTNSSPNRHHLIDMSVTRKGRDNRLGAASVSQSDTSASVSTLDFYDISSRVLLTFSAIMKLKTEECAKFAPDLYRFDYSNNNTQLRQDEVAAHTVSTTMA